MCDIINLHQCQKHRCDVNMLGPWQHRGEGKGKILLGCHAYMITYYISIKIYNNLDCMCQLNIQHHSLSIGGLPFELRSQGQKKDSGEGLDNPAQRWGLHLFIIHHQLIQPLMEAAESTC